MTETQYKLTAYHSHIHIQLLYSISTFDITKHWPLWKLRKHLFIWIPGYQVWHQREVCKIFCNFRKLILCRGLQITKTKKYELKVFSLLIYVQDGRPPLASFPPSNFVQTFRSAFFRKNSFFSKIGNFSKFSDFFAKALIFGSFSKNNIILYAFYGESVAFSWFWKNQVFFQENDQLTFKKTQIL